MEIPQRPLILITDDDGVLEQELSYDAWGNQRDPETWTGSSTIKPMFDRGFTGHEHMSAFGLINMNGRCYDPVTSSFLSVDAYVQSPESAQGFNRYSYCQNNPLRYTDPTGWQMVGGNRPDNPFHEDWSVSHVQHAYTPRDFGLMQLSDADPIIAWMAENEMHGGSGGESTIQGGWYRDANGKIQWNPTISSQNELTNSGIDGVFLGHTHTDLVNKTYYSLLGYEVDMTLQNGLSGMLMPLIDQCYVNYENDKHYTPIDAFDFYLPESSPVNLDVINYRAGDDNLYSFKTNGMTVYLMVTNASNGRKQNAMYSSFCGLYSCEQYNTNAHFGLSKHTILEPGYNLYFTNPYANQGCWRAMIVFPTAAIRNDFKQRYNQVFGYGKP